MPIVDHWANNRKRVEPHLEPGEQMLAFSAAGLSHGVVPTRPGPPPAGGKVAGVVEDVATGGVGDERKFDRIVFGVAVAGTPDSIAADAYRQASARGSSVFLGVTDRRMIILADDDSDPSTPEPLPLAWQIHRRDVTGADVHTRFLSFGRLRVTFRDSSSIVFVSLLLMGPTRAKRLRDALLGTATTAL